MQDAFAVAMEKWAQPGVPPNPGAWIVTTARNRAHRPLRRESTREARHAQALLLHQPDETEEVGPVRDDQLRLIFTCCHPALSPLAQTALTLRLLGGLEVPEIARAYLVPEATIAQRIVRAKKKIRDAAHPLPGPRRGGAARPAAAGADRALPDLQRGLHGDDRARCCAPICAAEAVRLARALADLMPDEPEVLGPARAAAAHRGPPAGPHGAVRRAGDPRRAGPLLWNRELIAEGHDLVRRCLRRDRPGPYQIQAAINAVHTDGPATDWTQVLALYDQLLGAHPDPDRRAQPRGRRRRGARTRGRPSPASRSWTCPGYHLLPATRADLLARLGRDRRGRRRLREAIALATNDTERAFLETRRADLASEVRG